MNEFRILEVMVFNQPQRGHLQQVAIARGLAQLWPLLKDVAMALRNDDIALGGVRPIACRSVCIGAWKVPAEGRRFALPGRHQDFQSRAEAFETMRSSCAEWPHLTGQGMKLRGIVWECVKHLDGNSALLKLAWLSLLVSPGHFVHLPEENPAKFEGGLCAPTSAIRAVLVASALRGRCDSIEDS